MINSGKYEVKILDDGWTAVSKDKSLSAQFEHTVGIKDNGYEIFTESVNGYVKPLIINDRKDILEKNLKIFGPKRINTKYG